VPHLAIHMPFATDRELRLALGLLTAMNVRIMTWQPLPELYKSGVRYSREPGTEAWLSATDVLSHKRADCEDLACYRAAELRVRGERATAIPIRWAHGWHIVVRRANGELEDPSVELGMPTGPIYFAAMAKARKENAA